MCGIHHTVVRGHLTAVEYLLKRYDSLSLVLDEEFSATLLHWAAAYSQHAVVRFLLMNHTEISVNTCCCDGSTALLWAVCANSVECVNALLDYNADVYVHDKKGQTCLHVAAMNGFLEIVKALVESGNTGLVGLVDCDGNTALKITTNSDIVTYLKGKSVKKKAF